MATSGTWFVLFPSSRTPRAAETESALREIVAARVEGRGGGVFVVGYGGLRISVALETKMHVLEESVELAGRLRIDEAARAFLSKCDHRFALACELEEHAELLNVLISASAKLRKITGGMVVDAYGVALVEPPLDPSALSDDPSRALLRMLDIVAEGGMGPRGFAIKHYATSAHVTTVTTARANGDVEVASSMGDRPIKRGSVAVARIQKAARAIVDSGFPKIVLPPGTPPPPPTVPPVSIEVVRGDARIDADVPASLLDVVPKFGVAVQEVASLGDGARAGAEAAKAAVTKLAEGQPAGPLTIQVRFVAEASRSFVLRLENNGTIVEEEYVGTRARQDTLGRTTPEERKAIGRTFLDAGFPEGHGKARAVKGPHYTVRVAHALDSVEVVVDAEDMEERGFDRAIRAMYAAAERFGPRPLALLAPPPKRSPHAPLPTPSVASEILDFVNRRIAFGTLARWLAESRNLYVPATPVEGGALAPLVERTTSTPSIAVCTSDEALERVFMRLPPGAPRVSMNGTWGAALFTNIPDGVIRIDIDPASPLTLQIQGEQLAALAAMARAVGVERALAAPEDPASARILLDFVYRVGFRQGVSSAVGGPQPALMISVPGPDGTPLAAAFTAEDCADAYFFASGGRQSGIAMGTMSGRDLFASLKFLRVEGVSFNPSGPAQGAVMAKDACARVAKSA